MNPDAFNTRADAALRAAEVYFLRESNLRFNPQYFTDFKHCWQLLDKYRTGVLFDLPSVQRLATLLRQKGWTDWDPNRAAALRKWTTALQNQRCITMEQVLFIEEDPQWEFAMLPPTREETARNAAPSLPFSLVSAAGSAPAFAAPTFVSAPPALRGPARRVGCNGQHFCDLLPQNCEHDEIQQALRTGHTKLFEYVDARGNLFALFTGEAPSEILYVKSPPDYLCDCPRDAVPATAIPSGRDNAVLKRLVRLLDEGVRVHCAQGGTQVRLNQQARRKGEGMITHCDQGFAPASDNQFSNIELKGACFVMNSQRKEDIERILGVELYAEARGRGRDAQEV